eukprot:2927954-Rhodomonas_salina.2
MSAVLRERMYGHSIVHSRRDRGGGLSGALRGWCLALQFPHARLSHPPAAGGSTEKSASCGHGCTRSGV